MSDEQLPLPGLTAQPPAPPPGLTASTPLHATWGDFRAYMARRDLSENTIKSFQYDLNLLGKFLDKKRAVGSISTRDLNEFVEWLRHDRGVPCNDKSLARRITSLKVFFGWLADTRVISSDPAAPLLQKPVSTPLPDILYDDQVQQLLTTTRMLRHGDKPDARPHLLVSLLLTTGIKKSECMAIRLSHLDLSQSAGPAVWIRYEDARHHLKERKLRLEADWPRALEEYKAQYPVDDKLFPWTARNLEYLLRDVGTLAGLPMPVSFEMLRWTCAVRDYAGGMSPEQLRHKMGLSRVTWIEAGDKIARLAAPAI